MRLRKPNLIKPHINQCIYKQTPLDEHHRSKDYHPPYMSAAHQQSTQTEAMSGLISGDCLRAGAARTAVARLGNHAAAAASTAATAAVVAAARRPPPMPRFLALDLRGAPLLSGLQINDRKIKIFFLLLFCFCVESADLTSHYACRLLSNSSRCK